MWKWHEEKASIGFRNGVWATFIQIKCQPLMCQHLNPQSCCQPSLSVRWSGQTAVTGLYDKPDRTKLITMSVVIAILQFNVFILGTIITAHFGFASNEDYKKHFEIGTWYVAIIRSILSAHNSSQNAPGRFSQPKWALNRPSSADSSIKSSCLPFNFFPDGLKFCQRQKQTMSLFS